MDENSTMHDRRNALIFFPIKFIAMQIYNRNI